MSERVTRHAPQSPCCGYAMDAASPAAGTDDNATPGPGDFSVCMRCGGFLRFGTGLALRVCTRADIDEMGDEVFLQLQRTAEVVRSSRWQRLMRGRR